MRFRVCAILTLLAFHAVAQTSELPPSLSGRWTFMSPGGVFIDTFSIAFDGNRVPGKVAGKLTWRGINCGAKEEPFEAMWDGTTLRFEARTKPNVNAQRVNGQCPSEPAQFLLSRKADGRSFDGEVRSGNAVVTMTASP